MVLPFLAVLLAATIIGIPLLPVAALLALSAISLFVVYSASAKDMSATLGHLMRLGLGFLVLLLVFTFFELLGDIIHNQIPLSKVFTYLFFLTPKLVYDTLPISLLVAILVNFGVLSKHNEVTAFKACGVSQSCQALNLRGRIWRQPDFREVRSPMARQYRHSDKQGSARHARLQRAARRQRDSAIEHRLGQLTQREREVMQLVVAGKLNKQIADELDISMKTVEAHRARVMEKMGVRTLAELVKAVMTVN